MLPVLCTVTVTLKSSLVVIVDGVSCRSVLEVESKTMCEALLYKNVTAEALTN